MYHKQNWKSLNEKIKVYLELCDFAFYLKYQELKIRKNKNNEKGFRKLLKTIQGVAENDF